MTYFFIRLSRFYPLLYYRARRFCPTMVESGLAYINNEKCNPFDLFQEWMDESKSYGNIKTVYFNLATSNRNGDVSNRTVVLQHFEENSFVFMTDGNSKKIQQIKENSKVAACFFWNYEKDNKFIHRQVRVEGNTEQLAKEKCVEFYNRGPLFTKIRSHICQQDQKVIWDDLKKKHDELVQEITTTNKELPMPEYQVAYKIIPNKFDFYLAWDTTIADRLEFIKSGDQWKFHHVAA